MGTKLYVQHFSVSGVIFLQERKFVDLKDLERPEDVTDVLRSLKERGLTNHMRVLTGHLGQSVLIVNTESKLKRSERQTLLEHEKSLRLNTVFGTHVY